MRLAEESARRIECFCVRRPLLALLTIDESTGKPVLWVKTIKNGNIVTEVILTTGSMRVRCRECLRFHRFDLWPERKQSFVRELE